MSKEDIKTKIENIRDQIRRADYFYYVASDPEISDKEYDELLSRLKSLEDKYPQFITADSPSQRVAKGLSQTLPTVAHRVKMLSLDNTYSIEQLRDWELKVKRMIKRTVDIDYIVEPKIDGVSCSLTYENRILKLAATRGDGAVGEDVTASLKTLKTIPLRLPPASPRSLEVRGEVYIAKEDFLKMNRLRAAGNEPVFANARNAASGSLKLLDPAIAAKRNLRCIIHSFGWIEGKELKTQRDFLKVLGDWQLPTDSFARYCKNMEEVIDYCLLSQDRRDRFPYEVDGMVVKVNFFKLQAELGSTLKSPRWAVAYKFPAYQATTTIEKVEYGVGRTGIITPVAILKPVECSGVVIRRVTLHNFDEVKRLDARCGDTVLIERAGDVIPKIIKVILSKRTGRETKISLPKTCPVCGGKVAKLKEAEVYVYCVSPDCPAQLKRSLLHFGSRDAMDIEGMGERVVDELIDRQAVKSISDIYCLKKSQLLELPLFKEKKAVNLLNSIEKSKKKKLANFLYGLGIPHVGEKAASILAARFKSLEALFTVSKSELQEIDEIGPVMAQSIVNFFSFNKTKKMLLAMKANGLVLSRGGQETKNNFLAGKKFVFTGELASFPRQKAKALIKERGGECLSSLSKNSDYLVAGAKPGSKYKKAKELNVAILDESQFKRILGL
jgi:DNA ligase (NAD+)